MTENNGLSNGDDAVDILNRLVFLVFRVTANVVLLDVVQRLLFTEKPRKHSEWRIRERERGQSERFAVYEPHNNRIGNDVLGELHDLFVVRGGEEHHLTGLGKMPASQSKYEVSEQSRVVFSEIDLLVNANALILVALRGNHHVGLVQHEDRDFLHINHLELDHPVEYLAGCSDNYVIGDSGSTCD